MTEYKENTWVIIMAGGIGSRFWPMSQEDNPKQFLDVLNKGKSMLQMTFERFETVCPRRNIIIVTSNEYVARVHGQLPGLEPWQVLGEPVRRNTAPCIAYAASVIHAMCPEANIVVSPSDHYIRNKEAFSRNIEQALAVTRDNDCVVTIGVKPSSPNTSYGYIQFAEEPALPSMPNLHDAVTFMEKPPLEVALRFLDAGEFFWNSGILVWRLPVLMDAYRRYLPLVAESFFGLTLETPAEQLEYVYSQSEAVSVDIGIMEKATGVYVLEATFEWSDVESWSTLADACGSDGEGNCIVRGNVVTDNVRNTIVHVPADFTLALEGLDNYIVAGNENTLLVCRRTEEARIAKLISDIEMESERQRQKNTHQE